jgi:hypothetical protein
MVRDRIQDIVEHLPEIAHLDVEDKKLLPGRISDHKNYRNLVRCRLVVSLFINGRFRILPDEFKLFPQ